MRYERAAATDDWELVEIVKSGNDRPCSDQYANANPKEIKQIFRELVLLRASGAPPNRDLGNPVVELWKKPCPGEHHQSEFWVLKAKPSGWRLYLMVDRPPRRLIFLYAVHKKKDDRDQKDFTKLCRFRDDVRTGRAHLCPIDIPAR